jgi:putative transcriptional regulator
MAERYRNSALAAVHQTALGLKEAGALAKRTMKEFDELCLTPVEPAQRRSNPADQNAREGEPGRVRPLSQRHDRPHQPMGARREASAWRGAEAADTGGEEGVAGGRVGNV